MDKEDNLLKVLELYKKGKFSLGKCAEIAGISNMEFLKFLNSKKIPLNLEDEDILNGVDDI